MEIKDRCKCSQTGVYTIKEFDIDKDYEEYSSWFEHLKHKAPSKHMLSTLGFVVKKDINLCSGFLYITNSNIATLEFIIANPKAKREDRKEGLRKLLTHMEAESKSMGYEINIIYTGTIGFSKNLIENFGYTKSSNTVEHIKNI